MPLKSVNIDTNIRKIDSDVFKGLVNQGNPNLGQHISDALGSITDAGDKIQRSIRDKQDADQKKRLLQQEDYTKAQQTFTVPPNDADSVHVANAKVEAANGLANLASENAALHRDNKITIEEYKLQDAKLKQGLSRINAGEAYINGQATSFDDMSKNPDTISRSTSPEAIAFAKAARNGKISMRFNPDTADLEYYGTWKDADGVEHDVKDFPVGKEGRAAQLNFKTEDPKNKLSNTNIEINKNFQDTSIKNGIEWKGTSWEDPQVQVKYETVIDEMVSDSSNLLSIATDFLDIDVDEAYELQRQATETGGDALQVLVKERLLAQAKHQFFGNESGRESAGHKIYRQNEALKAKQTTGSNVSLSEGDKKFNREVTDAKYNLGLANDAIQSGNYDQLTKLPGISRVKKSGDNVYLYAKDGGKRTKLSDDEATRAQQLTNFLGVGGSVLQQIAADAQEQQEQANQANYSNINTGRQ